MDQDFSVAKLEEFHNKDSTELKKFIESQEQAFDNYKKTSKVIELQRKKILQQDLGDETLEDFEAKLTLRDLKNLHSEFQVKKE